MQKVTKALHKKVINRNAQAQHKKLSWVLKYINEKFSQQSKINIENNTFNTVKSAEILAAQIYKINCKYYIASKATVSLVQGVKHFAKKIQEKPVTSTQVEQLDKRNKKN